MDFYRFLNVDKDASPSEIRKAYIKGSLKYHPDKGGDKELFNKLNLAYTTLNDVELRKDYDKKLETGEALPDDDDSAAADDNVSGYLRPSRNMSDAYKEKLEQWIDEFDAFVVLNNLESCLVDIVSAFLKDEPDIHLEHQSHCCICCKNVPRDHMTSMLSQYRDFIVTYQTRPVNDILRGITGDDIMDWKPITYTPTIPIDTWKSEKFNEMSTVNKQVKECVSILQGTGLDPWTQYLVYNKPMEDIVKELSQVGIVEYMPSNNDVKLLYNAIRFDAPIQDVSIWSAFKSNETEKSNKSRQPINMLNCDSLVSHSKERVKQLVGESLPYDLIDNRWRLDCFNSTCSICQKRFGWFTRRHHCRGCGEIQCADCQRLMALPQHGYDFPVRTCMTCVRNQKDVAINTLFSHIDRLSKTPIDRSCKTHNDAGVSVLLGVCKMYYDNKGIKQQKQFLELGKKFYDSKQYNLALQCYCYVGITLQSWHSIIESLVHNECYSLAYTCLKYLISMKLMTVSDIYQYAFDVQKKSFAKYGKLALLCFISLGITPEQILEVAVKYHDQGNYDMCGLCLEYVKNKPSSLSSKWLSLGFEVLKSCNDKHGSLAVAYIHFSGMTLEKWLKLLSDNSEVFTMTAVAHSLKCVDWIYKPVAWDKIKITDYTQVLIYLCCIISNSSGLDRWMDHLLDRFKFNNMNYIILCINVMVELLKIPSWAELRRKYIATQQYDMMMICHKIATLLEDHKESNEETWKTLAISLLDKDNIAACQCFDVYEMDGHLLADDLFSLGKYEVALTYYIRDLLPTNYKTVLEKARILYQNKQRMLAFKYYLAVYNKISGCAHVKVNIILELSKILYKENAGNADRVIELLIAVLKTPDSNAVLGIQVLLGQLLTITMETSAPQTEIIIAMLHISKFSDMIATGPTEDLLNVKVHGLYNKVHTFLNGRFAAILREVIYKMDIKEVANVLETATSTNSIAIDDILKELVQGDMEQLPENYRAILYIVRAGGKKAVGQYTDALNDLQKALMCYPIPDTVEIVSRWLLQTEFRTEIHRSLMNDIMKFAGLLKGGKVSEFSSCEMLFADITIPTICMYQGMLKANGQLNAIRKSEKAILTRLSNEPEKAAMTYIDLVQGVGDTCGTINCFIMASLYFLKAMRETEDSSRLYAYRNIIFDLLLTVFVLGRKHVDPVIMLYTCKTAFTILIQANLILSKYVPKDGAMLGEKKLLVGQQHENVFRELLKNIVGYSKVVPFGKTTVMTGFDVIFTGLIGREFLSEYLPLIPGDTILPIHMVKYHIFDGSWKGWLSDDHEDFTNSRMEAMQALLDTQGWTVNDVHQMLAWPCIQRTPDGWLHDYATPLAIGGKAFSRVDGVRFNLDTGEIAFLFSSTDSDMFNMEDVADVLTGGIISSFFTLNQPDFDLQSHPFQEMLYAPKALARTNYLATLLHADYDLKQISMDTEVNSQPPFEMRSAREGFMKRLPNRLRSMFESISERKNANRGFDSTAHRFWIEAGELVYDKEVSGNIITIRFRDIKMCVKKHLLKTTEEGELVDDENDKGHDDSPEAEFARVFTDNYDEIGRYFPELLRLKELLKLGAISYHIQNLYLGLEDAKQNIEIDRQEIVDYLIGIEDKVTYPIDTSDKLDEMVTECLRNNGVTRSQVSWSELNRVETDFKRQLKEADDEVFAKILSAVSNSVSIPESSLRGFVFEWLTYGYRTQLIDYIVEIMKNKQVVKLDKICQTVKRMDVKINLDRQEKEDMSSTGECVWVPAAFKHGERHKVYGGVNLGLNIKQGSSGSGSDGNGSGGSGGRSGGGPSYVVSLNQATGKEWANATCVNRVTGERMTYATGYRATDANNTTQKYWKPGYNSPVEHYTSHKDGTLNKHYDNGSKDVYRAKK